MTVEEFSNEFDILVNSYRRFKALDHMEQLDSLDFNEYEKSIYLTKAQEEIVKELYSGTYTGDSFESSEQLRRELDYLVTQRSYYDSDKDGEIPCLTDNKFIHTVFSLPQDCLYIVYEQVSWDSDNNCLNGRVVDVVPVTHDEYWRVRNNPFRGPNGKKVLRLDRGIFYVELVSSINIGEYLIRYIRKPSPIVLTVLPDETIDGVNTPQSCELNESLHRYILERAVRQAIASKAASAKSKDDK